MNDIRRTLLWVVFGLSSAMLWDQWQLHNGKQPTFNLMPPTAAQKANMAAIQSVELAKQPNSPAALAQADKENALSLVQNNPTFQPEQAAAFPKKRIDIDTDLLKLTFDTEGGTLVHSEFIKYKNTLHGVDGVVLFNDQPNHLYLARTGLLALDNNTLPNHKTNMALVDGPRTMLDGQNTLVIRFESPEMNGVKLRKTYTFQRGQYAVQVEHEVINNTNQAINPKLYWQLVRDGNPPADTSGTRFSSSFTGAAVYTANKKYQKADFKDIEKNNATIENTATDGYIAMVQHYFASAWIVPQGVPRDLAMRKIDANVYAVEATSTLGSIPAQGSKTMASQLFLGPQVEKKLEQITPGLELVKDYGWQAILAKPLYWLLDWLNGFIENWGWSIVALVVLIKLAFYWFNAKAYASMAKMKAVTPKITAMRERLKDKPQEMQMEMMKIYREEKVNPIGGCLPMLIQMPVFLALYSMLSSTVEMRHTPWLGWVHDLSAPDPYFILPVVLMATSLFQTALNPAPADPMQAKMMWFMPLIFSVMFMFFPVGLVLYWITNNVLTVVQQWHINNRLGVPLSITLPDFVKQWFKK